MGKQATGPPRVGECWQINQYPLAADWWPVSILPRCTCGQLSVRLQRSRLDSDRVWAWPAGPSVRTRPCLSSLFALIKADTRLAAGLAIKSGLWCAEPACSCSRCQPRSVKLVACCWQPMRRQSVCSKFRLSTGNSPGCVHLSSENRIDVLQAARMTRQPNSVNLTQETKSTAKSRAQSLESAQGAQRASWLTFGVEDSSVWRF